MTPTLNWRELELLARDIAARTEGTFVERVIIPDRPEFPAGYLKSEWALRLSSRRSEGTLIFSARPRHPYVSFLDGKQLKLSPSATRSPFDLALSKHLKGARLLEVTSLPRERVVTLWFSEPGGSARLGLVLFLIPATPEALLVRGDRETEMRWRIIARSRTLRGDAARSEDAEWFTPPDGSQAPQDPPVRAELVKSAAAFHAGIERALSDEAFELRLRAAERALRDLLKQARARAAQSQGAATQAGKEPDWKRYGDLLKAALPDPAPVVDGKRALVDRYGTGEPVEIPSDPALSPTEQVEKFYHLGRRKQRRLEEAENRLATFRETVARLEALLANPPRPGDFRALEKLERAAGTAVERLPTPGPGRDAGRKLKKAGRAWLGRTFHSKEGLAIYVGKTRDENLELTFKVARGNDLWMHVRGKPGAHTVIALPGGKSASLETLLDAANLTLYYSGGEKWGKTEVDYTFKKYVRRIKDSTEASYTNNRTLIVEPDPARLKRLLGSE